jgi:predicted AAA+ superfamily ATPase
MTEYSRHIMPQIENRLFKNKVVILYGPRQVGKTTLSKRLLKNHDSESGYFNCEFPSVRSAIIGKDPEQILSALGTNHRLIVLDEAQSIPDIGLVLKMLIDARPDVQIIATGSSSFDLANKTAEPLTGRKFEFFLSPLSMSEIYPDSPLNQSAALTERMVFGAYPEVVAHTGSRQEKIERLELLASSYLYKDILMYDEVKSSDVLLGLLRSLALQIGSEVSYNELASLVGIDKNTIKRYIELLEKSYIIFRLLPLTRNRQDEIRKLRKVYFYDLGIRNSVIGNFSDLESRGDTGALWENFLATERLKTIRNFDLPSHLYYWRTHRGAELNWLEESDGKLRPHQFNHQGSNLDLRSATEFASSYPDSADVGLIGPSNFVDFVENTAI